MVSQTLGTCIIVLDKDKKKVLIGKRLNADSDTTPGLYGLPGGRLEKEEQILECGKRELFEETKLEACSLKYTGTIRELKKDYSFIHFAYLCEEYTGNLTVTEPEKCESWEWVSFEDIPENILPGHKAAIEIFLNPNLPNIKDISSL